MKKKLQSPGCKPLEYRLDDDGSVPRYLVFFHGFDELLDLRWDLPATQRTRVSVQYSHVHLRNEEQ